MIKHAEKSVIIMTTNEGAHRKLKILKKNLEKAKSKGVEVKIYYSFKDSGALANNLKSFAEIKDSNGLKSRMCIVDCSEILLMLLGEGEAHEDSDVAVWLNAPFVASALNTLIQKN
jgi:hydrogenase maturation factor